MNPLRRAWEKLEEIYGVRAPTTALENRDIYPLAFQDGLDQIMNYAGTSYFLQPMTSLGKSLEQVAPGFTGLIDYAYKSNGVVFAVELARLMLFSQVTFKWQNKRTRKLSTTTDLTPLESPWEGGTTADLLAGMIQDADFAGNAFVRRMPGGRLERMRPDWTVIVSGSFNDPNLSGWDPGAEVIGYLYYVGGITSGTDPVAIDAREVAHFAPVPDPCARWRGMSWLSPIIREVMGDTAATRHKLAFFENGATVNLAIVFDPNVQADAFNKWVDLFEAGHTGAANAYKTLYLGGGVADAKALGANFQQMEFKVTQGAGETRIAAAGGVPPVIVGLSEGLAAATYSNYGQARRSFGDRMAWLWQNAAGSLERIIPAPPGYRLWYDASEIPFLREDEKDRAEIMQTKAIALRELVNSGWEPESAKAALESGDASLLKHTGLVSVQLQPPGSEMPGTIDNAVTSLVKKQNGNGAKPSANGQASDGRQLAFDIAALIAARAEPPHIEVAAPEVHVHLDEPKKVRTTIERDEDERPTGIVKEVIE